MVFEDGGAAGLSLLLAKLIFVGDDGGEFDFLADIFEVDHPIVILFAQLSAD